MSTSAPYPLQLEFHAARSITRWRPLVQWLLAIPHLMIALALRSLRQVLTLISFFTVLFTKRIPRPIFDAIVMTYRYEWRAVSYAFFMHEDYPPFDFDLSSEDDGMEPHSSLRLAYPEHLEPVTGTSQQWVRQSITGSRWYLLPADPALGVRLADMEALDLTVVDRALAEGLAWRRDGNELVKIWAGEDFAEALSYVNEVGALAEKADHHPDIDIQWNKVTLRLSTHSAGALTQKDLDLASAIDALGKP